MKDIRNILIVTGFPTEGAGSGALISTQAESYIKEGYNVEIITANNRTNFKQIEGVKYVLVPFTGEDRDPSTGKKIEPENIEGQLPFNYPMFTTHTESTKNFWDMPYSELQQYIDKYRSVINTEIKKFNPDVIHGQHLWLTSAICEEEAKKICEEENRPLIPTVLTCHGTGLMGFDRSKEEMLKISKRLDEISLEYKNPNIEETRKHELENELKDLNEEYKKYKYYQTTAKEAVANSNKVIIISDDQMKKFKQTFPENSEKALIIRNGYNPDVFHMETGYTREEVLGHLHSKNTDNGNIPTDYDAMALFVGKFAKFKGIDVLLDSAKIYEEKLANEDLKIITIIVGSGAEEENLINQAKQLKLQNVHFVGRQNHDTIRKLHSLSNLALVPSRNEPDGLVVKEAMACGDPVIGTNSGGIPETMNTTGKKIIKDLYNESKYGNDENILKPIEENIYKTDVGMLVPMDDSESLSRAVEMVVKKEISFDKNKISKYAEETYAQDKIIQELINLFESVKEENEEIFQKKNKEQPSIVDDEEQR